MHTPTLLLTFAIAFGTFAASQSSSYSPPGQQPLSPQFQSLVTSYANSTLTRYPTQLTQGILPIAIHSHNDYWRPIPFYSALSVGAISVEADVWHFSDKNDSTLYVGHELSALTSSRTLHSLYIAPILDTLRRQNPNTTFIGAPGSTKNGVFDTASTQTLYLFIDVKTDGATTWPAVIKALQPLREAGYLTTVRNTTTLSPGAVTVIGTGNTPLNQIQGVAERDYFYDAPLALLNSTFSNITSLVSPIASTNFGAVFGDVRNETFPATQQQEALLTGQVAVAHAKGIMCRYWNQPGWPVGTRNGIWRGLWDRGVDLLNVDDLTGAEAFWEGSE
jgi:hypothetical protein